MLTTRPPNPSAADVTSIKAWCSKFVETGTAGDIDRSGRPSVSHKTVDAVLETFRRSPVKSTRRASNEIRATKNFVYYTYSRTQLYFT